MLMKVLHLCLGCFFPDNYSYQENMLPKFHKELGYEVEVIASLQTFDSRGKVTYLDVAKTYRNEYDIKVTRLCYKKPEALYHKLKRYIGTYQALDKANPDIIFIHGCQFLDMDTVVSYLKTHPGKKVYVDNHCDYSNSATNLLSKYILHKLLWKHAAQIIEPYTIKFYGVLPARVDWLINMYKLPQNKCELLVMGADDEEVQRASSEKNKQKVRQKLGFSPNDFVIVTGGKIDAWKTQTLLLMEAVSQLNKSNVKLLIFGPVANEIEKDFQSKFDNRIMKYISWADTSASYDYFAIANLAVFPGRHSVYWEQVAGLGIPMLCKYWEGTTHIDVGGNVRFLMCDSVDEIYNNIYEIVCNKHIYEGMCKAAKNKGKRRFSYKEIAKRSIGIREKD